MESRRRIRLQVVVTVCALVSLAATSLAVATAPRDSVRLSLSPTSGGVGSIYTLKVTGTVTKKYEQLALTMVTNHGKPCPADYAKGFQFSEGLAKANGQPMGPVYLRVGKLSKMIKAKITNGSDPGPHSICAYLTIGPKTRAHAGKVLTILPGP